MSDQTPEQGNSLVTNEIVRLVPQIAEWIGRQLMETTLANKQPQEPRMSTTDPATQTPQQPQPPQPQQPQPQPDETDEPNPTTQPNPQPQQDGD